jgi:predicted ArsR family transcriptional regulator
MTEHPTNVDPVDAIASLSDDLRRALYRYVVERGVPVGRDEAAKAVGIGRPLAAYHLDRLADQGLLDVRYERPEGRSGPGAGRPSKLYTRGARQIAVTLPPRHYELAAQLLAAAVEEAGSAETRAALRRAARRLGAAFAPRAQAPVKSRPRARQALFEALESHGYEPYEDSDGEIRMRNCPFHRLSAEHTDLVCGMNLAVMQGFQDAGGAPGFKARLDPRPGECCVAFRRAASNDVTP